MKKISLAFLLAFACSAPKDRAAIERAPLAGSPADPAPALTFASVATSTAGVHRANKPASFAPCTPIAGTPVYGMNMIDLDGDGDLDLYLVDHGMSCGAAWMNQGDGTFGPNIWSGAMAGQDLGLTNELMYVGDFTGDGLADSYFLSWSTRGLLCVNLGAAQHGDWYGPTFYCREGGEPVRFGDVNGDGKVDVQVIDNAAPPAAARWCGRGVSWRVNNGSTNVSTWPIERNEFTFVGLAAPGSWLDLNVDGQPDGLDCTSGGLRMLLGQAGGTYQTQAASGLEGINDPGQSVKVEDVNFDGCPDVGQDHSGYRDNQRWFVQARSGSTCLGTFTEQGLAQLGYYPGFKRYAADLDNDGLIDVATVALNGYGWPPSGVDSGVNIYRRLPAGGFANQHAAGLNILGTAAFTFYSESISIGDWNQDGRLDVSGNGDGTIPNSEGGAALWTSGLATTNHWLDVRVPTLVGWFSGAATIAVYDAGHAGDAAYLASEVTTVRTGEALTGRRWHFGVGLRTTVDVLVTFAGGSTSSALAVAVDGVVTVNVVANQPPVAVATAAPASASVGQAIAFDGTGSSDPDGTISSYAWTFGDGGTASTATAAHAYAAPGAYVAHLVVTDNGGATAEATVEVVVADVQAPTLALGILRITPIAADDVGVASVTWTIDGLEQEPPAAAPWYLVVDLDALDPGPHHVEAIARDAAGNASPPAPLDFSR